MPRTFIPAPASLALALALAGCAAGPAGPRASSADPDARSFSGNIISLRFTTATMIISETPHAAPAGAPPVPNIVEVKYDAHTRFFLDGQPTTLDKLDRYMPVQVDGHMRDGQMFAETARFSSKLPPGINPSEVEPGPAPIQPQPR